MGARLQGPETPLDTLARVGRGDRLSPVLGHIGDVGTKGGPVFLGVKFGCRVFMGGVGWTQKITSVARVIA